MAQSREYLTRLAFNVSRIRKQRGYTVRELAEIVDVDYSYISHIENSKANPSIKLLMKIADGLEVDFLDLFEGYGEEKRY